MQTRRFDPTIQPEREWFAPPNRTDIVGKIDGVRFEQAWKNQVDALMEGDSPTDVISREDLIPNRLGSDRERGILSTDKGFGEQRFMLQAPSQELRRGERRISPATERRVGVAPESFLSRTVQWTMIRESQIGIPRCGISSRKRRSILMYGPFSPIFEGSNRRIGLPLCCVAFTLACA
jgi:hypothetical protein